MIVFHTHAVAVPHMQHLFQTGKLTVLTAYGNKSCSAQHMKYIAGAQEQLWLALWVAEVAYLVQVVMNSSHDFFFGLGRQDLP